MIPPTELIHKLQLKSGDRVWLVNVPAAMAEELAAGAEVEIVGFNERCTAVLACFNGPQEVATVLPEILSVLEEGGLLWTGFRQGEAGQAAGLTRDTGWTPLEEAGWAPVHLVDIGETWSALRWEPRRQPEA